MSEMILEVRVMRKLVVAKASGRGLRIEYTQANVLSPQAYDTPVIIQLSRAQATELAASIKAILTEGGER